MLDDAFVGFSNVCDMRQRLSKRWGSLIWARAAYLWSAERPRRGTAGMGTMGLRQLLMGAPFGDVEEEKRVASELNMHLEAMTELLPRLYGDTEACKQAVLEIRSVVAMESVLCKRAMFLFGLGTEREMCDHWRGRQADGSAALAQDLSSRVLPFVMPRFLKHSCQRPDALLQAALMLADMWSGESLGNWPAHHNAAIG